MKIYTKKGDQGNTSLFGGQTVKKDHFRIQAYGTVDELNSFLGVVLSFEPTNSIIPIIQRIQNELFILGADLATPAEKQTHVLRIEEKHIHQLEADIDFFDAQLPQLTSFILPGGTKAASFMHVCRTVCRRAERLTLNAVEQDEANAQTLIYLNRLSDLFFVLSRFENASTNTAETKWTAN